MLVEQLVAPARLCSGSTLPLRCRYPKRLLTPSRGYHIGELLTLKLNPDFASETPQSSERILRVRVQELRTQTLSFTMVVSVLNEPPQKQTHQVAVLKLFDRRFSEQLRKDNGIEPWDQGLEHPLVQSVSSGSSIHFLDDLHNIPNIQDDTEEGWNDAQNEAFFG